MKKLELLLFILLLIGMGLIGSGIHRHWATFSLEVLVDILVIIYIFLGVLLLFLALFFRDKDLFRKGKEASISFREMLLLLTSSILIAFYFLLIAKLLPYLKSLRNLKEVNNVTMTNATVIPPSLLHQKYSSPVLFYLPILLLLFVFVLSLISMTNELREVKKKRKIKKHLQEFDKKLEERGINLFSNPREAVIELYKKAVLWLEMLGIPYKESWTHWEHAEKVMYKRKAYVELAKLFEKAKYAPEKVTLEDARRAYRLYMVIKGEE
ncbi:DUF4129 domain-containing protein [Pyrococcus kukulkanii]|uniref:DUF4129 domain-containing protein n=1 Tax=Pyrococcus kukulkanii TaxID=1609559 RepID=UPI00356172C0